MTMFIREYQSTICDTMPPSRHDKGTDRPCEVLESEVVRSEAIQDNLHGSELYLLCFCYAHWLSPPNLISVSGNGEGRYSRNEPSM